MIAKGTSSRSKLPLAGLLAVVLLAFGAVNARAAATIEDFTVGTSTTQAGGHPNLTTSFTLASPGQPEAARNIAFNAPEGVFGNPNAALTCDASDFAFQRCPFDTQIGLVTVRANHEGDPDLLLGTAPLYVMQTGADETARFAFIVPILHIPVNIPVTVRTESDYGLRFTVSEITQETPLSGADLTFWGFPAEDANDSDRFPTGTPGNPAGCPGLATTACAPSTAATIPEIPLTINPTICTGEPLVATLEVETYQDPGAITSEEASYPATTGCEKQVFRPVLYANPTTNETDSPSGVSVELVSPQFLTRATAPSQIRSAIVTFPSGFTINPDAADGQTMCTDQQANFGRDLAAECPNNSKIGTFHLTTVALSGPLQGAVYIGEPKPGNQYRLFLVASGFGINAKLRAEVRPDPITGQVRIHTQDLPQVPFDRISMYLFGSDRALMATPTHCTIYPVDAQFFPWNDRLADQTSRQLFSLDSGPNGTFCPPEVRPFNPRLAAGTSTPVAGAFSSFHLKLDRDDGDQFLRDLNFTMPPGFTGDLRGIPYCPEESIALAAQKLGRAEQAAPSCSAASQIGTTNVMAGPGDYPFNAVGRMYLAGPLRGAPLSLAAITPALAGPYDYGTQVVRVALHVDPLTAQVRALSEPMPLIIGGVPLRMRSIRVNIDRERFTINPTNCSSFTVDSQGVGDQGTAVGFSSPFTAVNCSTMPFKPRMAITQIDSRKRTKRNQNPRLRFDLHTRPGDANLESVAVTLPKAFAIDQRHLGNICSKAQLEAEHCAGRQKIGDAWVKTPLLDQPLGGPVYAVSGFGKLPRLAFLLAGQVTIIPQAQSLSIRGGFLRTTVPVIPDAPVGHFRLTLLGGKQGYLINTRDLCVAPVVTTIEYNAQSGKRLTQRVRTKTLCPNQRKAKRSARSQR